MICEKMIRKPLTDIPPALRTIMQKWYATCIDDQLAMQVGLNRALNYERSAG
jgi:hypothetical protein